MPYQVRDEEYFSDKVSAGEMEWYKDMGPSVDKIERQARNLQCTACHKQVSFTAPIGYIDTDYSDRSLTVTLMANPTFLKKCHCRHIIAYSDTLPWSQWRHCKQIISLKKLLCSV